MQKLVIKSQGVLKYEDLAHPIVLFIQLNTVMSLPYFTGTHQYRNRKAMSRTTMDMAMMLHMNAWLLLRMLRLIISLVEKKHGYLSFASNIAL